MANFTNFLTSDSSEIVALTEGKTLKSKVKGIVIGDLITAIYQDVGETEFSNKDISTALGSLGLTAKDASNIFFALKKDGLINSPSKGRMQIPSSVVAELGLGGKKTVQPEPETKIASTKAIKNLTTTKAVKFKVPKVSQGSKYLEQMVTLLDHMDSSADGITKKTYMLAGDPGTGKTSFIESLGTLTGIPLVVIEAPHITQEHLINIPFLVIDGKKRKEGNIAIADSDSESFKIVQAESALVTTLKSKKKRPAKEVQQFINQNKVLRDIQPKLQYEIDLVKERFNAILFLDEFYRTTSKKIRNVLRNILNGKIGDDKIPKGVYIIMATNINDDGIDDIPENHDFNLMKYDTPDKEDLFNYFYGKYVDNPEEGDNFDPDNARTRSGLQMKPEVFNNFYSQVKESDLSRNDEDADVRLSPRRLEQMMIFVDSQTPCKDIAAANTLISYVKNSLTNYLEDGEKGISEMVKPFTNIVKDIIKETSDLAPDLVDSANPLGRTSWPELLDAQIDSKIKLGESRKYVPIVSGDPGIGKTSSAVAIARSKNMGFIQIDISNRSPEDFTGMPNADMGGDNITVEFTEPALYRLIMQDYEEQIEEFRQPGRPYNIILLFDEMNRTSPAVFNSMRKILLEKEFSDSYKLPDDIMMMGAINPKGEGTMEFTSHTRDVLDIIPASAVFSDVMNYAKNVKKIRGINSTIGFDLSTVVANVMTMYADDFHSTKSAADAEFELEQGEQGFWWAFGAQIVYISGREFTEALFEIVVKTQKSFRRMGWDVTAQFSEEEYDKFIDEAIVIFAKYLGMGLNMVVVKMQTEDFVPALQDRIINDDRVRKMYKVIKEKKSVGAISIHQMLEETEYSVKGLGKAAMGQYIRDYTPSQVTQDLEQVINSVIHAKAPVEAVSKILEIVAKVKKSMIGAGANNEYIDKINKHVRATLSDQLATGVLPIVTIMKNTDLMSDIEQLVS